jgi:DNA-binding NarL/FixJ family response regulator
MNLREVFEMPAQDAELSQSGYRRIRILVADDHPAVRNGLVRLLNSQPQFAVICEASDGVEAVRQAAVHAPDVVVIDMDMPNLNGADATRRMKQQWPDILVIGLTAYEEGDIAEGMTKAGAVALVSKQAAPEEIIETIRRVLPTGCR